LIVVVAFLAIGSALTSESGPTRLTSGELDLEAVEMVTTFSEFPVLWLGTEFEGYPLTSAAVDFSRVVMVYGSCDRGRQTSCAPPLAISIWAPNSPYGRSVFPGMYIDEATSKRGLPFHEELHSVRLTTAGIAIEIQSEIGEFDRIIDALRLANGGLVGLPEIGPGESLAPLLHE
jgi:hypothetical protein